MRRSTTRKDPSRRSPSRPRSAAQAVDDAAAKAKKNARGRGKKRCLRAAGGGVVRGVGEPREGAVDQEVVEDPQGQDAQIDDAEGSLEEEPVEAEERRPGGGRRGGEGEEDREVRREEARPARLGPR